MQYTFDEFRCIKQRIRQARCVQFRIFNAHLMRHISFEHTESQYWQRSVEQIVDGYIHRIENGLTKSIK